MMELEKDYEKQSYLLRGHTREEWTSFIDDFDGLMENAGYKRSREFDCFPSMYVVQYEREDNLVTLHLSELRSDTDFHTIHTRLDIERTTKASSRTTSGIDAIIDDFKDKEMIR